MNWTHALYMILLLVLLAIPLATAKNVAFSVNVSGCNKTLAIISTKKIYEAEPIIFSFKVDGSPKITYWVEDSKGKIVKDAWTTHSKTNKHFTPSSKKPGEFTIKAFSDEICKHRVNTEENVVYRLNDTTETTDISETYVSINTLNDAAGVVGPIKNNKNDFLYKITVPEKVKERIPLKINVSLINNEENKSLVIESRLYSGTRMKGSSKKSVYLRMRENKTIIMEIKDVVPAGKYRLTTKIYSNKRKSPYVVTSNIEITSHPVVHYNKLANLTSPKKIFLGKDERTRRYLPYILGMAVFIVLTGMILKRQ